MFSVAEELGSYLLNDSVAEAAQKNHNIPTLFLFTRAQEGTPEEVSPAHQTLPACISCSLNWILLLHRRGILFK